jgi:hypothetical protein
MRIDNAYMITMQPDEQNVRFCRHCSRFLPVVEFPKGVTRYLCKRHWIAQIYACNKHHRDKQQKHQQNTKTKTISIISKDKQETKDIAKQILRQCKRDAKLFSPCDPMIYCLELNEMNIHKKILLLNQCQKDEESVSMYYFVPRDPSLHWNIANSYICENDQQRQLAIAFWNVYKCPAKYMKFLNFMVSMNNES